MMEEIPVVDISSFLEFERSGKIEGLNDLYREWNEAFSSIGFATVTGHGIPDAICENIQKDAVSFFKQDLEEKMKSSVNAGYGKGGYVRKGLESVAKTVVYNEKENDNRIRVESRPVADYVETMEYIHGLGDEKSDLAFPQYPNTLGANMEAYWGSIREFYQRLMKISALALGLNADYFIDYFHDPYERMRMAFYPSQEKEKPKANQMRYGAHTDYACFAVVRQDDSPGGLQVLHSSGAWIAVRNVPSSFVVNCGDLMQRWTNDCWKSVIHRVVNPPEDKSNTHRLSLVLFVGPNRNSVIKPLETCCSEENPAKYKPIGCKEHLERKLTISNA